MFNELKEIMEHTANGTQKDESKNEMSELKIWIGEIKNPVEDLTHRPNKWTWR